MSNHLPPSVDVHNSFKKAPLEEASNLRILMIYVPPEMLIEKNISNTLKKLCWHNHLLSGISELC